MSDTPLSMNFEQATAALTTLFNKQIVEELREQQLKVSELEGKIISMHNGIIDRIKELERGAADMSIAEGGEHPVKIQLQDPEELGGAE